MPVRTNLRKLRVIAKSHPGRVLIQWYTTEEVTRFVNLRNIRLLVCDGNSIKILPGTVTRDDGGDQQLLFASSGLCRISTGKRRGMIVEPTRLRVGEKASETGLIKNLQDPGQTNSIYMSDERDAALIERLENAYDDAVDLSEILYPNAYIRTKSPEDLTMRLNGEVTKELMSLESYNRRLSMDDNFTNLIGEYALTDDDDPKYRVFPFNMVQGNGLLVVDIESLPPAMLVPEKALDKENELIRIRL